VEHFSFRLIRRVFFFVLLLQALEGLHGLLQGQLYLFLLAASGIHRNQRTRSGLTANRRDVLHTTVSVFGHLDHGATPNAYRYCIALRHLRKRSHSAEPQACNILLWTDAVLGLIPCSDGHERLVGKQLCTSISGRRSCGKYEYSYYTG
jgi:hypothetical protein